jgi:CheY-like chemotaxis protein
MSHGHILLVEDDDTMADAVALVLRLDGYEVDLATDGTEGIERARESRPEVILLDPYILGVSGAEFVEAVRTDPVIARTPIVLMTPGMQPTPNPTGHGVLLEPVNVHELFAAVHDLLGDRTPNHPHASA